jgi:UDP:flavonoid glycosyltransferase YjiC (YdhE family)
MKILIASTPATGHLNPLLAIGHILIAEGHEVVDLSGSALRERIENIGAEFRPLPEGADLDLRDILSEAPELKEYRRGRTVRGEGSGTPSGTFLGIPASLSSGLAGSI